MDQIKTMIAATLDHTCEVSHQEFFTQVRRIELEADRRDSSPRHDLQVAVEADHIAGSALEFDRIVFLHEPYSETVVEARSCSPQSFFQQSAGRGGFSHQKPRGVKLHHLHVD